MIGDEGELVLDTTPYHREAFGRCRPGNFGGTEVPFLSCQDIAEFREAFFNPSKDWADLEEMQSAGPPRSRKSPLCWWSISALTMRGCANSNPCAHVERPALTGKTTTETAAAGEAGGPRHRAPVVYGKGDA